MKIGLTSVYVDNLDKALRFCADVLGFVTKADFTNGPYRWLTVASPEDPDGTELQLALNDIWAKRCPSSKYGAIEIRPFTPADRWPSAWSSKG